MIESPYLNRFASDFLDFVKKQTGTTAPLTIEVFLCNEQDWATVTMNLGISKKRQKNNDSFMWTFALVRNQFGQFQPSTESERIQKLVEAGFEPQAASTMSCYDTYVLLRNALLTTPAKLHQTAYQTIQALCMVRDPTGSRPGRGSHALNHTQLYEDFKAQVDPTEFEMRYFEPTSKF